MKNRFKFMLVVCAGVFVASATKMWLQRSPAMSLFEAQFEAAVGDVQTEICELSWDED